MLNDKLNYDQVPNKEAWGISDERTENFMKEKVMLVLQNVQKPTADQMKEAEDYVIKEVQQYLDCIGNILQHFLTSISNNYTETQSSHYLEKKESKIKGAGLGLFTNKFIKRGEIITRYADCNPEFNKNQDFLGYQANDNAFDPTSQKNKYHIQRNNAEFQHKSLIIATRDINKGEEIYLSYGKDFWFESEERGDRVISRADEIRYGMTKEDYDKSKPNKKSKKNQKKIKRR
jgi:hypothetical protein